MHLIKGETNNSETQHSVRVVLGRTTLTISLLDEVDKGSQSALDKIESKKSNSPSLVGALQSVD